MRVFDWRTCPASQQTAFSFLSPMNERCWEANESEEDRGLSRQQATGGFRSMHPFARLPTRVRRPASSPDVIRTPDPTRPSPRPHPPRGSHQLRRYPMKRRELRRNQVLVLRKPDPPLIGDIFSLGHFFLFKSSDRIDVIF